MNTTNRFRCPACGFAVYNRRVSTCESCGANLPEELLLTARQLAYIDTEHARDEKIRGELARKAEELRKQRERRRGDGG